MPGSVSTTPKRSRYHELEAAQRAAIVRVIEIALREVPHA